MNDKIKKFYYPSRNSIHVKYLSKIYDNMITIIESSIITNNVYLIIIFFNLIQSISIALEISFYTSTHEDIKKYTRYFHLINYLTEQNISFSKFRILTYANYALVFTLYGLFYVVGLKKPKWLIKILRCVVGFLFFLVKYVLFHYQFNILISVYNFRSTTSEIKALKGLNAFFILLLLFMTHSINILYNDYSLYKKKLPWSSPYSNVSTALEFMKIYLCVAGNFFDKTFLFNLILVTTMAAGNMYLRLKCPFFFHIKLNYFTIFAEGTFLAFSVLYVFLSVFSENWLNFDAIYLFIISLSLGACYLIVVIIVDSSIIRNFHKKIEYALQTNKLNEYDLYIFMVRISIVIEQSKTDQKASNLILDFYSQHKMFCAEDDCICNKIETLIANKKVKIKEGVESHGEEDIINLKDEGSLIVSNDIIDEKEEKGFKGADKQKKDLKKHLKLWGMLIESIYEKLNISGHNYVKIEFANFLSHFMQKFIHSLIEVSYINPRLLRFHYHFYLYYSKQLLINSNKNLFESGVDVNFFTILEYNLYYEKFLSVIRESSKLSLALWNELQKNIFKPRLIENKGYILCENTTKLEKYSKVILGKNPNDLRLLKLYGTFLNHILKLPEEAKSFMDKAFLQIVMNKNEIDRSSISKTFVFPDDVESSTIVANGNKENIGRIEYVNNSFTDAFGFTKEEITGKNLSLIMPQNIGKNHNQFMMSFYSTSKTNFINNVRREIGLNKERLIIPIVICVKILPCIDDGIAYIGLIKKSTFSTLTKGPKHIRSNIGYIMTTDDGNLLHYNKVIQTKFGLIPRLMFDDTKDASEIFKIEMIFPELLLEEKRKQCNTEETRLYFTTKIIEKLKRMEYSKIYDILNKELKVFSDERTRQMTELKSKISQSKLKKGSRRCSLKMIKGFVSISQNAGEVDFQKKNSAAVSITKFSYIVKTSFLIYQIVFEKGVEQNISNIIKRYQQRFEEKQKKQTKIVGPNDLNEIASTLSIQSSIDSFEGAKKRQGNIINLFTSVRMNTFQKNSPKLIKGISVAFLFACLIVIIEALTELIISLIYGYRAKKSFKLVQVIQENFFELRLLEQVIYYYGLIRTGSIENRIGYNGLTSNEIYYEKIEDLLTNAVQKKEEMILRANFDSEIANILTESDLSFKTYYDEQSYTTTGQSLISSIIILVNYYNTLFSSFHDEAEMITYKTIISDSDGNYVLSEDANDIERTVVKNILTIRENFGVTMMNKYLEVMNRVVEKSRENYQNLHKLLFLLFLLCILLTVIFSLSYGIMYICLVKVRVKILLLFSDVTPTTLESCLFESQKFEKSIDQIVESDIFFLNNYYNDGVAEQKNFTTTTSSNIRNENALNNDFNLGMDNENKENEIKQVFKKYKKKDQISIKEFLEDRREIEQNLNPPTSSESQSKIILSYAFAKKDDTVVRGSINSMTVLENNDINKSTKVLDHINSIEDTEENTIVKEKTLLEKYKKRAIHRKAQLKKVDQYQKKHYFEKYTAIVFCFFFSFFLIFFMFPYFYVDNVLSAFSVYYNEILYKYTVTYLFPFITSSIVNGQISKPGYSERISNLYNTMKTLFNENLIFLTRKKSHFPLLFNEYQSYQNGTKACTVATNTTELYNFCMESYFSRGIELGIKEFVNLGLNHYNYIINVTENIESIEVRKNLINNETLQSGSDYNLFIIDNFFTIYLEIIRNSLKIKIENFIDIFISKIFFGFIVVGLMLGLYFLKLRKKYLKRYIFSKAMILLVPNEELSKAQFINIMRDLR